MERITKERLERKVAYLNKLMGYAPNTAEAFSMDWVSGSPSLVTNFESTSVIGRRSKTELYHAVEIFMDGIRAMQRKNDVHIGSLLNTLGS